MPRHHPPNLRCAPAARQGRRRRGLSLALCVALAACAAEGERAPADVPPGPADPGADRPEQVRGTILLEGMAEPMTFRLFRSPAGFPLPFSTYLPEDMRPAPAAADPTGEVRFVAAFGGTPDTATYVRVLVPVEATDAAAAEALARRVAGQLGTVEAGDAAAFPWAEQRFRARGPRGEVGHVALGRRGNDHFLLVARYPAEAGDGFGPRLHHILEQWRWADGTPLGG